MSEKPVVSNEAIRRRHRNIYFQPGQLIFHAYGNLGGASGIVQELIEWANKLATNGITLSVSPDDVFDFNPIQAPDVLPIISAQPTRLALNPNVSYKIPEVEIPQPFSLVFANATKEDWPEFLAVQEEWEDQEDWEDRDDMDDQDEPENQDKQDKAFTELLDFVILLDENRGEAPVRLEAVSPNWLISGSPSSPGGTGGPGGMPWPVDQADINKYHISLGQLNENSTLSQTFENGSSGNRVVVAILDTVYSEEQLEAIYETWVIGKPTEQEQHPLIKSLLGKNTLAKGALRNLDDSIRVYANPALEAYLPDVKIDGHDYDMTDHGLFVAGIINSLAPQAELHLYQVLNRYGLGDLRSIARALQHIYDDENFPKNQLVINLSLTINIPLEKAHGKKKKSKMLEKILDRIGKEEDSARYARSIEWICDLLYTQGSKVIAAAGNNRGAGRPRPLACYPAAFKSVLGVGALPSSKKPVDITEKRKTASYSNLSDKPQITGITTLGGEKGKKNGVLGVYVGQFPPKTNPHTVPNINGWGWWAGTSFATPIITGMVAAVRSFVPGLNSMEDAVDELFNAQVSKTEDNEDVLHVTQGT